MFKKMKLLLPLLAIAGALVVLPACGKKKCNRKGKTTERRDHRQKKAHRKDEKRRSFLFRK